MSAGCYQMSADCRQHVDRLKNSLLSNIQTLKKLKRYEN